jgi:hypothetical protein
VKKVKTVAPWCGVRSGSGIPIDWKNGDVWRVAVNKKTESEQWRRRRSGCVTRQLNTSARLKMCISPSMDYLTDWLAGWLARILCLIPFLLS